MSPGPTEKTYPDILRSRWLLLLIFPVGFLLTQNAYSAEWDYYFLLNMASFLSACLLLLRLRRITAGNIIIWAIFIIILIGYYLKYYFFVNIFLLGESDIELRLLVGGYAQRFASPELLLECFTTISLSFCLFAVTAYYLLYQGRAENGSSWIFSRERTWGRYFYVILVISVCLALASGSIRWFFRLDIPGEGAALPFKLHGLTTLTSSYVVPTLLGLALIYALRSNKRRTVRTALTVFFAWGIIQYVLFTGKTFLLVPVLWPVLIGLWLERPLVQHRYVIAYGALFVFIYPFLNIIRAVSRDGGSMNIFYRVSEAVRIGYDLADLTSPLSSMAMGIFGLISRISGLDSLLMLAAIRPEFGNISMLSGLLGETNSAEYILTDYLVGAGNGNGIAQSLIGQAYFHTGSGIMTAFFVAAWTVFAHYIAKVLYKTNSSFSQVIWVTWIIFVLQWTSDGITLLKLLFFAAAAVPVFFIKHHFEPKNNYFSFKAGLS